MMMHGGMGKRISGQNAEGIPGKRYIAGKCVHGFSPKQG